MEQKEKTNWSQHLSRWRESGKTKREYCTEHSLNTHTFDYHVYKHNHAGTIQHVADKENHFTRVELAVAQELVSEKIELHFADGRKVFLPLHTPHKTLRTIFLLK